MATPSAKTLLKRLPSIEQMREILYGLNHASDHAAAITGPSYLDRALEMLFEVAFRNLNRDDRTRMFDGAAGGILGTASAKIRLAYAMKLVEKDVYRDLLLINDIRNVFAHTLHQCSFENELVKKDCESLYFAPKDGLMMVIGHTPKGKFMCSIFVIFEHLLGKITPLLYAKALLSSETSQPTLPEK